MATRPLIVAGHEAVGRTIEVGGGVTGMAVGDRLGVAWLRSTCGVCRWCREGAENLCQSSMYTGWDDGGYAQSVTVPAAIAYRIPDWWRDHVGSGQSGPTRWTRVPSALARVGDDLDLGPAGVAVSGIVSAREEAAPDELPDPSHPTPSTAAASVV